MVIWEILVALVVIALIAIAATWLARRPTMAAPFRYLIIGIAVVFIVIIALKMFGLWEGVKNYRVERSSVSKMLT